MVEERTSGIQEPACWEVSSGSEAAKHALCDADWLHGDCPAKHGEAAIGPPRHTDLCGSLTGLNREHGVNGCSCAVIIETLTARSIVAFKEDFIRVLEWITSSVSEL
jgi:hypothetical protein